jgi:hypothetical protein
LRRAGAGEPEGQENGGQPVPTAKWNGHPLHTTRKTLRHREPDAIEHG